MKFSMQVNNIKTRGLRVDLPRNDICYTVRRLEVGKLEVTERHFWGFKTMNMQKRHILDFGLRFYRPMKFSMLVNNIKTYGIRVDLPKTASI